MKPIQDSPRLPMFPDQLSYLVELSTRIKLKLAGIEKDVTFLPKLDTDYLLKWAEHRQYLRKKGDVQIGSILVPFVDELVFDLLYLLNGKTPLKPIDQQRIEDLWFGIHYLEDLTYKVEVK